MDLSLISIEDLLKEAESRCVTFICSYELYKNEKSFMESRYGKGQWFEAVRLASVLNNDILNNWNGELKTLQRINEDRNIDD